MGKMFTDVRVSGLAPKEAAKELMNKMGYFNYKLKEVNSSLFADIEVLSRSGVNYFMILGKVPHGSYMYS